MINVLEIDARHFLIENNMTSTEVVVYFKKEIEKLLDCLFSVEINLGELIRGENLIYLVRNIDIKKCIENIYRKRSENDSVNNSITQSITYVKQIRNLIFIRVRWWKW